MKCVRLGASSFDYTIWKYFLKKYFALKSDICGCYRIFKYGDMYMGTLVWLVCGYVSVCV